MLVSPRHCCADPAPNLDMAVGASSRDRTSNGYTTCTARVTRSRQPYREISETTGLPCSRSVRSVTIVTSHPPKGNAAEATFGI
jgi:hypothetical protein